MKIVFLIVVVAIALAECKDEKKDAKPVVEDKKTKTDKPKRGLFELGYGYSGDHGSYDNDFSGGYRSGKGLDGGYSYSTFNRGYSTGYTNGGHGGLFIPNYDNDGADYHGVQYIGNEHSGAALYNSHNIDSGLNYVNGYGKQSYGDDIQGGHLIGNNGYISGDANIHDNSFGGHAVTITKNIPVPVPQPVIVDRPVKVPIHVKVPVPYPVEKKVIVEKTVPVIVEKKVPIHIDRPVKVPVPYPVKVPVTVVQKVHVPVPRPYAVHVPKPVFIEKQVPVVLHSGDGGFGNGAGFGGNSGFGGDSGFGGHNGFEGNQGYNGGHGSAGYEQEHSSGLEYINAGHGSQSYGQDGGYESYNQQGSYGHGAGIGSFGHGTGGSGYRTEVYHH